MDYCVLEKVWCRMTGSVHVLSLCIKVKGIREVVQSIEELVYSVYLERFMVE